MSHVGPPATDGGARADAVVVVGSFALLGAVCGVVWWLLVDPASFTKVGENGTMDEIELAKRFNADGWYSVIALVTGLFAGGLLTWWRSRDHRLTTILVFLGAWVAAGVMAVVGGWLGPGDPSRALELAPIGEQVPVDLVVSAAATYFVWPMAALVGALVVLWSPPKELDVEE